LILELNSVSKCFAGLQALSDVSFGVREREILAVIGPNGAGKTTLFNLITGVFPATGGAIRFDGLDIGDKSTAAIARAGVSRTFQHTHLFRSLTVLENVMFGRHYRTRAGILACGLRLPWAQHEEVAIRTRAMNYLDQLGLADKCNHIASELPLGEQRYIELARALATEPKLILLDEPAAGLNERETEEFRDLLLRVRESSVTLLIIEHHMRFVMEVSDRIVVLNFGTKIAEGSPAEVRNVPAVIDAYLGTEEELD
jgi:branched-chain amino acid transport system ATP-binding protein|tara:strand:+ start:3392 stop:4159 length:768 start_codon:yes stop_codon:yes gene_type:complete